MSEGLRPNKQRSTSSLKTASPASGFSTSPSIIGGIMPVEAIAALTSMAALWRSKRRDADDIKRRWQINRVN